MQQRASVQSDPCVQAVSGRRIFDAQAQAWMVKVFPGEYYVTKKPDELLVTVLGSCVAACIRDPIAHIGGMNHFMLPHHNSGNWGQDSRSARFGNFAMEKLINELIKAGADRNRMEVKVFGGGNVTDTSNAIGSENAEFVLRYLEAEGFRCAAQDLGGSLPRRIHYYPSTGRVVRKLLGTSDTFTVNREERDYGKRLLSQKTTGDIQLFGET
ncbi:chemoreceptor glutamine deamidase CheD [Pseudolabrys taiwanensis]|uniref:Probable chemoreceptor glutamine deamidase CheD n=2 Tax=Pseudolabrys taiwanensis TaxID=331696 RepID=A0A346A4H2_9HYPH|nr:chemoreceptor glutamine deamidase CheD [Pseudolabrys taiwanensis]